MKKIMKRYDMKDNKMHDIDCEYSKENLNTSGGYVSYKNPICSCKQSKVVCGACGSLIREGSLPELNALCEACEEIY